MAFDIRLGEKIKKKSGIKYKMGMMMKMLSSSQFSSLVQQCWWDEIWRKKSKHVYSLIYKLSHGYVNPTRRVSRRSSLIVVAEVGVVADFIIFSNHLGL